MTNLKPIKIPKGWEEIYAALTALTDECCAKHLNPEYAELARLAIAALCRKRPSPLVNGGAQTWACAVLYALGQINFLSDKASKPYMAMAALCEHFGIASSTGGNKAKVVRQALGIRQFDHRWTLPSRLASDLPPRVQEMAVKKGLIPFVWRPADDEAIELVGKPGTRV
jgi:hypothetical protein